MKCSVPKNDMKHLSSLKPSMVWARRLFLLPCFSMIDSEKRNISKGLLFFCKFRGLSVAQIKLLKFTNFAVSDHSIPLHSHMYAFDILIQSNLVIRNVLMWNKLVLRNHLLWPNANLLHKDKELLALRNNFRATKKFLIVKFDCNSTIGTKS